jgi:hypothetical protein
VRYFEKVGRDGETMSKCRLFTFATPSKYTGINLFKNIWGKLSDCDVNNK